MNKWGETIGNPLASQTPAKFHDYIKELRIDYRALKKVKLTEQGKLDGVSVRRNNKGTVIITNRRKPIKYITMEEIEFLSTHHGIPINEIYNKATQNGGVVYKNMEEATKD